MEGKIVDNGQLLVDSIRGKSDYKKLLKQIKSEGEIGFEADNLFPLGQ